MSENRNDRDPEVVHWEFDADETDPNVNVVEAVAELKGVEIDELTPLYTCIDNILEHLFSNPPVPSAQATIEFTYEDYRITVDQDGSATFRAHEVDEQDGDG